MNIANYVTFIRLFIGPLFFVLYVEHAALGIDAVEVPYFLLALLALSELSDAIDGYVARRLNQVTELGKILDPMADSISHTSIFLTFTQDPVQLPLLLVFIFLYRDSIVSTLRTVCALRGFALAARRSGKIKAVIQAVAAFITLGLMILAAQGQITQETLHTMSTRVIMLAAIYTLYSGIDYIYANRYYVKRMLKRSPISHGQS